MAVAVPPGGLTIGIGADGKLTGSLTLHVRFDVCPTWIAWVTAAIVHVPYYRWWRNGWLSDRNEPNFQTVVKQLFAELRNCLGLN